MARITIAGESLIAQKQGAQQLLQITRFIYANVPGLDPSAPVDRAAGKPPAGQIVHTYTIPAGNSGYVNPNQVVYSSMLGSDIGDFDWNWLGLESAEGVLFAVAYVPLQQKRKNIPPLQIGNNVTRNILVEYSGAQALTGISIDASTWQHDFTVRLAGIDERMRLSNRDTYGRSCFIGTAFQLEKVGSAYQLKPGTAYLGGVRISKTESTAVIVPGLPAKAWLDLCLQHQGNDLVPVLNVTFGAALADYIDAAGARHFVIPLAEIPSSSTIIDLRTAEAIDLPLVKAFATVQALQQVETKVTELVDGTTPAGKAKQLNTPRSIAISGAGTGTVTFDGTKDVAIPLTLADSGVQAGTYTKVQVNAKGLVVGGQALLASDIPALNWSKITAGKPTSLAGYGILDGIKRGDYGLGGTAFDISAQGPNDLQESGFYMGFDIPGAPSAGWWFIDNTRHNASWCGQTWRSFDGAQFMTRVQEGGVWRDFVTHFHTGNLDPSSIMPAGTVVMFATPVPPSGFLKANGAAVSRTTFARLFAVLGTSFGAGDGASTFNLPDLRGEFVRAWDDGRNLDNGRAFGTVQAGQNASHTHTASVTTDGAHTHSVSGTAASAGDHSHNLRKASSGNNTVGSYTSPANEGGTFATTELAGAHTHSVSGTAASAGGHTHTVSLGYEGGNEARPRNIALLACIKY